MEPAFAYCDDLGPEKIVHVHDAGVDLKGTVVVDNVAVGPSIGGVRMAKDVSTEECIRLARAMTLKNAAANLPHGGGKAVIYADPKMPEPGKERLMRAFARAIGTLTDYIPGPDMGTDETAMALIRDEIGRSVGLPRSLGGIPLDEIGATGFGLAAAADVAQDYCGLSLVGATVAIQGFGSVGIHAARFLAQRGASLVAASDSRGTVFDEAGLNVEALVHAKARGRSVAEAGVGKAASGDAIVGVNCDIWIPAARPDVVHEGNVDQLKAKLILEGANIPITPAAEASLHERGVLCVPDFIANAGGVICASVEYHGGTEGQAFAVIEEKLKANTRTVLEASRETGTLPRRAAMDLAKARVRDAMRYRRR